MPPTLREQIDQAIAGNASQAAREMLALLWRKEPGPAAAGFVLGRFEQLRDRLPLNRCKVAVLRSFTLETVIPLLRASAFVAGIDLEIRLGAFNAYSQEILDPGSWLDAFAPDGVILAIQTRDLVPSLWEKFADLDADEVNKAIDGAVDSLRELLRSLRQRCSAPVIVHALQIPPEPAMGLLDARNETGQADAIARINAGLVAAARAERNVYILDYNALIARHGAAAWQDERKWLTARMPIAAGMQIFLAEEWMRFLHPIAGRICKVLAVDLDNTLWGGVIGEDGPAGIKLDDAYPGAAFRAVQRALLDLHHRGIMLAICSKNNAADAIEALKHHPGMLVAPRHFSAMRINWADKADNLREIAAELNVGLDSVAFLDDNPAEREWVRSQLPEATVIDLPDDPMQFARAILRLPVFERLELTREDQARGQMYAEQRTRSELQCSAASLEDFYRSLHMRAMIEPIGDRNLVRAAQLTQKTNQFNLTSRRYGEQQLAALVARPDWQGVIIRVIDQFGDNGIVGVALLHFAEDNIAEIDTLLLSCRVIGRTIESALLAHLGQLAILRGATTLQGRYIPSKKNAPAADMYARHGFIRTSESDGETTWQYDLRGPALAPPAWIQLGSAET